MIEKSITVENNKICLRFPYSVGMVSRVKELYGRVWDKENNYWHLPAAPMYAKIAVSFGNEHNFTISGDVLKLARFNLNPVVKQDRTALYFFQGDAVDFIHNNGGNCIVADSCGLGKTIEALWAIKEQPNTVKVLVVCPASVIYKWQDEVKKWLGKDATIITKGSQDIPKEDDLLIMSYDILVRSVNKMDNYRFDLMILDEVHYISNHKTKRGKAIKNVHAKARLMLSGTPFLNRPIELWNILNTLNPYKWANYWSFANCYAGATKVKMGYKTFWTVDGATNIPELREILKPIMIRRLKQDVLKDLPELTRTVMPVDIEMTEYKSALRDLRKWLKEQGKVTVTLNALSKLNYLRQLVGKGKVKHAIEFAEDFLTDSDSRKLVIYCHHRAVVDMIVSALRSWGVETIVGSDSNIKRADTIRKFQEKTLPRVLVISEAGGMGVDLFKADTILTVELPWNGATVQQAEARLHRIGQKNAVSSYFLIAKDTIDEHIYEMVKDKDSVIAGVLGDENKVKWLLDKLI